MRLDELLQENNVLLAPMAGVTDSCFRGICKEMGCGLTCTEMVSAKGLHYRAGNTRALLVTAENERPCAVQIFGNDVDIMAEQAALLAERSDVCVIDINMGCPVQKITGNGEGSALMKQPKLAARIVRAVSGSVKLPVTVKIRKGWDEHSVNAVEFAKAMQDAGAAGVTVHGRTRAQKYAGKADWDIIAQVKRALTIPVIGNGDVFEPQQALRMLEQTGCDGVMVARGAVGNPWIFRSIARLRQGRPGYAPAPAERIAMARRHAVELFGVHGARAVAEMRKHVAWYIVGMRGAAGVRAAVNRCGSLEALCGILEEYEAEQTRLE